MKRFLLASACVFACALAAAPALADGIAATADGTFGNIAGAPDWSVNGSVFVPLDWNNLGVEGDLGDFGAGPLHVFHGGGDVIWSDPMFRIAGSVIYNQLNAGGSSINETQYGAGVEWYAMPELTLAVDGGGTGGTASGGYVAGTVKYYFMPDLALDGFIHYNSLSSLNITDFGADAEWLPFEEMPVSVGATYDHLQASGAGSGNTDSWMVKVKLYLNDSPATTLVDRQRTGTLDVITPASVNFVF